MFKIILNLFLFFGILGCGTMFDKKKNSDSQHKITIPKQHFIEIPKILKREKNKVSEGYIRIKENIAKVEHSQKISKIYRLLAEQIIDEVQKKCKKIPINKICVIEPKEISIIFNDKFMKDMESITKEKPSDAIQALKNQPILLGRVEFGHFNDTQKYQYELKMDTTPITHAFGIPKISMQRIGWSKDEKNLLTHISDESNRTTTEMIVIYHQHENGDKEMSTDSKYNGKTTIDTANFHLNLIEKNDINRTFEIKTDTQSKEFYEEEFYELNSSSTGYISDQGGYLSIIELINFKPSKEYYVFDKNGTVVLTEQPLE